MKKEELKKTYILYEYNEQTNDIKYLWESCNREKIASYLQVDKKHLNRYLNYSLDNEQKKKKNNNYIAFVDYIEE